MLSLPLRCDALKVSALSSIEPVTLDTCDREPIHIPGSIQAHGCLLACDIGLTKIERASGNAGAILGMRAA